MKNVFISQFNNEADMLIHVENVSVKQIALALLYRSFEFSEIYEIKDDEVQFYCFDERMLQDDEFEKNVEIMSMRFMGERMGEYDSVCRQYSL